MNHSIDIPWHSSLLGFSNSHYDNRSRCPYRPWLTIHRAVAGSFF